MLELEWALNSKIDILVKRQIFGDTDNVENAASPVAD